MNPYATTMYKLKHTTDETKDCYIGSTDDMKTRITTRLFIMTEIDVPPKFLSSAEEHPREKTKKCFPLKKMLGPLADVACLYV